MVKNVTVEKTFCTTREAGALLGVSVGTIQLWVENGLLEAWKTSGGHRRVSRDSIDRLIRTPAGPVLTSAPETPPPPVATEPTRKPMVLVVEDDRMLLKLYEVHLSKWQFNMDYICLDNAVAALMAIGRKTPDVLIADLQMPHMNGIEMIRMLRSQPDTRHLKIIAITGMDPEDIRNAGGLPPDVEIYRKPIPFDQLKETVQAFLTGANPPAGATSAWGRSAVAPA